MTPIEKRVRYATSVPTVQDAFVFVMDHLDEIAEPHIEISPRHWQDALPGVDDDGWHLEYGVVIDGRVEEKWGSHRD